VLTEALISSLVDRVCAGSVIPFGELQIDFTRPWTRLTMREAIIHYWPDEHARPALDDLSTREGLLKVIEHSGHKMDTRLGYGYLLGELFEQVAEPRLTNPTFITEFPTELSPLSKQSERDHAFVDRFELYIAGMEIANAFCEINDPVDQRQRFEAQMGLREHGDDEAMLIDEDYIRALRYGMPPTAGEGIGIDRLTMILTDQKSIRDVILFPHMRIETQKG